MNLITTVLQQTAENTYEWPQITLSTHNVHRRKNRKVGDKRPIDIIQNYTELWAQEQYHLNINVIGLAFA